MVSLAGPSSTPHVIRVSASSRGDRQSEIPLLKAELADNIVHGMDFRLFVRETCKFPDSSYQAIKEAVELETFGPSAEWDALMETVSAVRFGSEPDLYGPLIGLYDWVCGHLGKILGIQSATGLQFRNTSDTPLLDSTAARKPDMTGVSSSIDAGTVSWKDALVCWEVKHKKRGAQYHLDEPPRNKSRSSDSRSKPSNSEVSDSKPGGGSNNSLTQLLSYCLEMISAQPHRRHTIGVLLSQWKLQLVYQSRSYVVVSDALDIRQDRVKLTVAIAALWAASLETLGFDSHFVDNHGNPTVRSEGCQVAIEEQVHQIEKILFRSRSVFGRGTATLGTAGQVQAVIKFNCPPKSREPEATMLKRAQDIRNIIKVDACAVWGDTLQGFGPEFIKAVSRFEVREFRILVLSPFCVPLTEILELEDFKRSFRKLVIAHHELYKIGILHCDISVGNLMYDPVGKEPYLIDTDLGKPINELASPSSQHRTGTLPFMATDLLVERPPPHLYRHDLESFYYVLVWIVVPDHCGWHMVHSIASMRKEKSDFLAIGPDSADKIDRLIFDDRFEPLRQSWICHIHSNFLKGRAAVDPFLRNENSNTDTETLGGLITFDKFIALLQDSNELEQSLAQV